MTDKSKKHQKKGHEKLHGHKEISKKDLGKVHGGIIQGDEHKLGPGGTQHKLGPGGTQHLLGPGGTEKPRF